MDRSHRENGETSLSTVIEELRLRNFEGYKRAELEFSAGLNLIRGRNSSGKSTLLDALVFGLFGEAPDVRPRLLFSKLPGSSEMTVYVKFRSPRTGATVEVGRKGRLDSRGGYRTEERLLRLNGKEVSIEGDEDLRAKITELMGASLRKFLNLVYVRQGKLGAILEPAREEMDSVIGITLMRELREQFRQARKDLDEYDGKNVTTEAQTIENTIIPQLETSVHQTSADIELLGNDVRKLEETVRRGGSSELTDLLARITEKGKNDTRRREIQASIQASLRNSGVSSPEELGSRIDALNLQHRKLSEKQRQMEGQVGNLLEVWTKGRGGSGALETEIGEHQSLLERGISKCPTCGQDLRPASLRKILKEKKAKLEKLRAKEDEAKKVYDTKRLSFDELNAKVVAIDTELLGVNSVKKDLDTYLISAGLLDEAIRKSLPRIRDLLGELDLPFQPEDAELMVKIAQQLPIQPEELSKRRTELQLKQKSLEDKISQKKKGEDELKTSTERLSKLKSRMEQAKVAQDLSERFDLGVEARRKDTLRRIEFKALEYYKSMTDQHVYSAITVDPETYVVWVHPKGLTEAIPATRVGGGHQTILALSMRLALLDTLGFRSLLILDEPTYGIDSNNLPQLASYIGEASRKLSQMILVTHYNICEEEASNIIQVTVGEDRVSRAEVRL